MFKFIASVAAKKQGIMDMIWDKKLKMNNYDRTNTMINKGYEKHTLLGKPTGAPQTRREIDLLCGRLEKIFPVGKNMNKY